MTALDRYTRLEAIGQWREAPNQPPTEVVVSFGDATLVLSDLNENPLCHWAMAATNRVSLNGSHAIYTPDTEGFETLEIDDAEMVEAISRVSSAESVGRHKTRWLRWVFALFLFAMAGGITYATPDLLRAQAERMTSPASARKLGMDMFQTLDLKLCHEARADEAKTLFEARAFPDTDVELLIVQGDLTEYVFPGNIIVLGSAHLRSFASVEELTAVLWSAMSEKSNSDTINALFSDSSPRELFDYVTSGTLPSERIRTAAQGIMAEPSPLSSSSTITNQGKILRDQDWVALQGICLE